VLRRWCSEPLLVRALSFGWVRAALTTLANDETIAETWRGYALLTLANLAVTKGDLPAASKWLNQMDKRLRKDHVWREYKDSLIRSEPGLLNPVAAPAGK
jgi:hypothetical protein